MIRPVSAGSIGKCNVMLPADACRRRLLRVGGGTGRQLPFAGVVHDKVAGRVSSEVAYRTAQPSEGETAQCLADCGHTRSQAQQRMIAV